MNIGRTYISRDTGNYDLRLASFLYGSLEIWIVPCIDFTVTLDERRVRVHVDDLLGKRTIRTCNVPK
jgi:hypothetical protein